MLGQCIIAPRPTETRPSWPPDCPLQLSCACWRSQDATLIHVSIHVDSLFRDLHLSKRIFKDIYVGSFLDFLIIWIIWISITWNQHIWRESDIIDRIRHRFPGPWWLADGLVKSSRGRVEWIAQTLASWTSRVKHDS